MRVLLSDQFSMFDETFDQICNEFEVQLRPSWQHKWFYRYLQISPSYFYVKTLVDPFEPGKKKPKGYKKVCPNYDEVVRTYASLGDVWIMEFTRWWFLIGQSQFFYKKEFPVELLASISAKQKIDVNFVNSTLATTKKCLKKLNATPSCTDYIFMGVPLHKDKKETLKMVENFLDQYTTFTQPDIPLGNMFIYKSKLKEKTISDCYRALEIRVRYPDLSLIEVARRANTLKTSLAGLEDDDDGAFARSVRSGISRQIKMASRIAENAARGFFPVTLDAKGMYSTLFSPDAKFRLIFEKIGDQLPLRSQLLNTLREHIPLIIDIAENGKHRNLKRSY
jgi:hypothetical protein